MENQLEIYDFSLSIENFKIIKKQMKKNMFDKK